MTTMAARLRVYAPDGAAQDYLSEPVSWRASLPTNDVSALQLDYAIAGANAALLGVACEVAVEVNTGSGWIEPRNARYRRLEVTSDRAAGAADVRRYTMPGYASLLDGVVVIPAAYGAAELHDQDGKRKFLSAPVGQILATVLQEARTLVANLIPGLQLGFTPTHDARGVLWAKRVTIYYEPGMSLLTILDNLAQQGLCDWWMQGRTLHVVNVESAAVDTGVRLLGDVTEAPVRSSLAGLLHTAFLVGDEATWRVDNPGTPTPWGTSMRVLTQGGVRDEGTAQALIGAELAAGGQERTEYTIAQPVAAAAVLPLSDYQPGDWVQAQGRAGWERMRVWQITLGFGNDGLSCALTLNDRFVDSEVRNAKRTRGIVNGATGDAGTGGVPSKPTTVRPSTPTGLVSSSLGYWVGKTPRSSVQAGWAAVTTDVQGNAIITDHYLLRIAGKTVKVSGHSGGVDDLEPNKAVSVEVAAVSSSGVQSGWASRSQLTDYPLAKLDPPTAPTLTVANGIVTVLWDGTVQAGGQPYAPPLHFDRADVYEAVSASGPWTAVGTIVAGALVLDRQTELGTTYHYRLIAVDTRGVASNPGPSASVLVESAVAQAVLDAQTAASDAWTMATDAKGDAKAAHDLASDLTTTATDAHNAAVDALNKAIAAANAGGNLILNGGFEQVNAAGNPVEWASGTTISYPTTGQRSGSRCLRLTAPTGNAWPPSAWVPSSSGRSYYMEGWVKRTAGTDHTKRVAVVMQVRTAAGGTANHLVGTPVPAVGADWQRVSITLTPPTANITAIRFAPWLEMSDNEVLWDDLLAVDVTEAMAAQQAAEAAQAAAATATEALTAAVTGSVTEYAVNTSETAAPTTGWSTSTPTRTAGSYIWVRTKITYGDGTSTTANPALLTGNTGATGSAGATGATGSAGVSVTSITTYFRQQATGDAAPATPTTATPPSKWVTTEPGYVTGTALYRTEKVSYSNGTFSYTPVSRVSSYDAAVQAMVSANGRNSRIVSILAATGTTNPDTGLALVKGDTWWRWDNETARNVIGAWVWDGAGWRIEKITDAAIANLDVNKLVVTGSARMAQAVANKIVADMGYYGSLIAEKVAVGGIDNLAPPMTAENKWTGSGGTFVNVTDSSTGRGLRMVPTANASYTSPPFAVTPGEEFYMQTTVGRIGSSRENGGRWYFGVTPYAADGTRLAWGTYAISADVESRKWGSVMSGTVTIPAGAATARIRLALEPATATPITDAHTTFYDVIARRKVGTVMIADGAITAPKVLADEALITKLLTDELVGGKITAPMFHTNAAFTGPGVRIDRTGVYLTGVQLATLTINTEVGIRATNRTGEGTFRVDMDGNATFKGNVVGSIVTGSRVQTADTGVPRAVMTPFYDASGNIVSGALVIDTEQGLPLLEITANPSAPANLIMYDRASGVKGQERFRLQSDGYTRWRSPAGRRTLQIQSEDSGLYSSATIYGPEQGSDYSYLTMGVSTIDGVLSRTAGLYSTGPDASRVWIHGSGSWYLGSSTRGRIQMANDSGEIAIYPRSNLLSFYGLPTTTSTGQPITMIVSGTGRPSIYVNTSLRASKVGIADLDDPAKVLDLNPQTFFDARQMAAWMGRELPTLDGEPDQLAPATEPRRSVGLIAEDVRDAGLLDLCTWDGQGNLTGVAYDRVALALIPLVRDLRDRITALEDGA